eukprot:gene8220-biopygen12121
MLEFWVKSNDVWWIESASGTGPATPSAPRHSGQSGGQSGPVVTQYGRGRGRAQGYADFLWFQDTRQKILRPRCSEVLEGGGGGSGARDHHTTQSRSQVKLFFSRTTLRPRAAPRRDAASSCASARHLAGARGLEAWEKRLRARPARVRCRFSLGDGAAPPRVSGITGGGGGIRSAEEPLLTHSPL